MAGDMAAAPSQSLPKQCDPWGDLKAAYGFLNNPKTTPDQIQSAHRQLVRQTCRSHQLVLAIQDTTELDFTGRWAVEGLGPIGDGRGRGLLQHSTLAVTPDGSLVGVLYQIYKTRVPAPKGETRNQRRASPVPPSRTFGTNRWRRSGESGLTRGWCTWLIGAVMIQLRDLAQMATDPPTKDPQWFIRLKPAAPRRGIGQFW